MPKSKGEKIIRKAYKRGYRVKQNGTVINPDGKELSINEGSRGYLKASTLNIDGVDYPIYIHRLVAFQKFGEEIFEEGKQVRHLNSNKKDNSPGNIGIGTQSENMMDRPKDVRGKVAKAGSFKVNDEQAREIRDRVENGNYTTYKDLAEEYGLRSKSSISYIVNNRKIGKYQY